jgi:hypothetical protein
MVKVVMGDKHHVDSLQFDSEDFHIVFQWGWRLSIGVVTHVVKDTVIVSLYQIRDPDFGFQGRIGSVILNKRQNLQRCGGPEVSDRLDLEVVEQGQGAVVALALTVLQRSRTKQNEGKKNNKDSQHYAQHGKAPGRSIGRVDVKITKNHPSAAYIAGPGDPEGSVPQRVY